MVVVQWIFFLWYSRSCGSLDFYLTVYSVKPLLV